MTAPLRERLEALIEHHRQQRSLYESGTIGFILHRDADATLRAVLARLDAVGEPVACSSYFPDEVTDNCIRCGQSQAAHAAPPTREEVVREETDFRFSPRMEGSLDAIDAGLFSGDTFHSAEAVERLRYFMARWEKELASILKLLEPK